MTANNRAKLIGKLHTALKKHYTPVPTATRPLLEHILYASLLQDATYAMADEGIVKCEQDFYDWNEVRVTTVTELSQVLSNLPDPVKAAARLKGNLLEIFEEFFSFDIDHLKKENLGKAVAKFEKMSQMTPFVLSYAVQNGLGGHSIPVDYAAMVVLLSTEIVDQSEASDGRVPGLERAIPKTKGVEFGSLLHQCAVDLLLDPQHKDARAVLDATNKGSSKRFDEWSDEKEAAKKRVKRRKTSERAAAKKKALEDEQNEDAEPVAAKKKGKTAAKGKPSGPSKPKTAPPVEKTTATKSAAAKAKKSAASSKDKDSETKTASSGSRVKKPKTTAKSETEAAGESSTESKASKKATSKKKAASKTASAKTAAPKASPTKASSAKAAKKPAATKKAAKKSTASKSTASKPKTASSKSAKASAAKSNNRRLTKKKPK